MDVIFECWSLAVLIVELQRWFFVSLVVVWIHVGIMMLYIIVFLSTLFVVGFFGFSSKPSPIYGGVGLIVSGAVGCSIIVNCGGSFLGLMVFLIYLGGILVIFGYTTAIAIELYPDTWLSNVVVIISFLIGVIIEVVFVAVILFEEGVNFVVGLDKMGDWSICNVGSLDFFSGEVAGVAALYSYGIWLIVITGWSLFIGVVVILEVTRGN